MEDKAWSSANPASRFSSTTYSLASVAKEAGPTDHRRIFPDNESDSRQAGEQDKPPFEVEHIGRELHSRKLLAKSPFACGPPLGAADDIPSPSACDRIFRPRRLHPGGRRRAIGVFTSAKGGRSRPDVRQEFAVLFPAGIPVGEAAIPIASGSAPMSGLYQGPPNTRSDINGTSSASGVRPPLKRP